MFAERLRQVREHRRLGVRELSRLSGVSSGRISDYENGKSTPQVFALVELATALQVSADYLVGLTDDPTPPQSPQDLSSQERALIAALRAGDKERAMRLLLDMQ